MLEQRNIIDVFQEMKLFICLLPKPKSSCEWTYNISQVKKHTPSIPRLQLEVGLKNTS